MDPVTYRIAMLNDDARAATVVKTVADMANWSQKRRGRAVGIAYSDALHSYTAAAAEVSVDEASGQIKVHTSGPRSTLVSPAAAADREPDRRGQARQAPLGARKIRELLVRRLDGDIRVPAKSTIHAVLHRHGLVKLPGRPRHRATGTPLSTGAAPHDLWCAISRASSSSA